MPEVTWTVSAATIFVVIGWVLTGGFQTFRIARYITGLERDVAQLSRENEQLRRDGDAVAARIAELKRETDVYHASYAASIALQKDQIAEHRQSVAERYATKEALAETERRLVNVTERIMDGLDGLRTQMNDVMKAVHGLRKT